VFDLDVLEESWKVKSRCLWPQWW